MGQDIASILRFLNILFALAHLPLLFCRIRGGQPRGYMSAGLGLAAICMGIVQGTWATFYQELRPGTALITLGLTVSLASLFMREKRSHARRVQRCADK